MPFVSIAEAIEEIRTGRMLIVVDDEDREYEGDLTIAAEKVSPEVMNFMATHGRGLICLTLTPERCDALQLPLMSPHNTSNFGTGCCESIDAREGATTGISAADRNPHHSHRYPAGCSQPILSRRQSGPRELNAGHQMKEREKQERQIHKPPIRQA